MMKKYTIPTFWLFGIFLCLSIFTTCTYDYFEDETNYEVYVPKANTDIMAEQYRVEDVRIFIYQGHLEKEKSLRFPYQENARTKVGNYYFRLTPRSHDVYCFANTSGFDFLDLDDYENAGFGFSKTSDNKYSYADDLTAFYAEYLNPTMNYPGPIVTDTARFERRYVGRIYFAFKNLNVNGRPLSVDKIAKVKIEASGVGTFQKFSLLSDSINTRSSRYSPSDKVLLNSSPYLEPYQDFEFGVHNCYYPSLESDDEKIKLKIELVNAQGTILYTVSVDVFDVLHTNQDLYLAIDGDKVYKLSIDTPEEWNSTIESGGNTTPGGGGIIV